MPQNLLLFQFSNKKTGKWLLIGRKNKYEENDRKLERMGIECKRFIENSEERSMCGKLS